MSTEQKPATEPKSEPNALAAGLNNTWTKFKEGKLLSYPMMALILVVVAAVAVGWWVLYERRKAESAKWVELEGLTTVKDLDEYAQKYPNSIQAKLAKLEAARLHLGPEGMDRMFIKPSDISPVPGDLEAEKKARELHDTSVKNVEKAREEFTKLVDEFKDDPIIKVECMLACAKAEAVLVGIPMEGQLAQRRGNPSKAVEWLDKVTEAAPDTPWGKDAKKLADALRNQNTEQQVATLQASLFEISPSLPLPKMPTQPKFPFGHP